MPACRPPPQFPTPSLCFPMPRAVRSDAEAQGGMSERKTAAREGKVPGLCLQQPAQQVIEPGAPRGRIPDPESFVQAVALLPATEEKLAPTLQRFINGGKGVGIRRPLHDKPRLPKP